MWKLESKIGQVKTIVDKVIPFSGGAVVKAGTWCEIASVDFGKAKVLLIDDAGVFQRMWLEYAFSELDYDSTITNVVWVEDTRNG